MAYKDKEKAKAQRKYWEEHIRSEESKKRKKETTRLWILNQRKKRVEQELKNGEELGYSGVRIRNDIRKRIEDGITKILVNNDGSIMCFHKNEDGHCVNNTNGKKYLHRERKSYSKVTRTFYLGDVNEEEINANFKNGILVITAPKNKEIETKKTISITEGE